MSTIEVKVPDIGDFKDIPVIELFVKPGDAVKAEDSLVTLESDKATMDVPSPAAGVVVAVALKLGDKVSEGALIMTLDTAAAGAAKPAAQSAPPTAASSNDVNKHHGVWPSRGDTCSPAWPRGAHQVEWSIIQRRS